MLSNFECIPQWKTAFKELKKNKVRIKTKKKTCKSISIGKNPMQC